MTDLNQAVQRASDDIHNTAVSAQQALAAVTEAAKAITAAAQSANAQVGHVGTLVDSVQNATQQVITVVRDADGKINEIKVPWLFRK
jgi:hypothetical protein